jgi:hypothetical protein
MKPPGLLRRKLARLEIEAEMIELDQLGSLIPGTGPSAPQPTPRVPRRQSKPSSRRAPVPRSETTTAE